jgi:Fe(3+) dicitrate transport protein
VRDTLRTIAACLVGGLIPLAAPRAVAGAIERDSAPAHDDGAMAWRGEQQAGRIVGVVRSAESGEGLRGVMVEVEGSGVRVETDVTGGYALEGVPAGRRVVRYGHAGWRPVVDTVLVGAGTTARRDVVLSVLPVPLGGLDVLLDRTRLVGAGGRLATIPGSAHVVTGSDLTGLPTAHGDVHAVLRQVPGVSVQEEDGYGLRPNIGMRGTGVERSSKIAILEDGVLAAPAPYAAPAAYYFPVVGRMEAVEVRKGSSQIRHGPWTTGGVLNVVSSGIPGLLRLDADVAGGEDAARRMHVKAGASYAHAGWLVETYQLATDGFKRLDGAGGTGFDVRDALMKVRLNTSRAARVYQEVELKAGWSDERSDETYLGLTAADFEATPLRRYAASQKDQMNADHRQLALRYLLSARGFDVTTTLYRQDFSRNWYKLDAVAGVSIADVLDTPDEHVAELAILRGADSDADALRVRANRRDYYSEGVQSAVGLSLPIAGAVHAFEFGLRYHRDAEDRFQHDDGYRMLSGALVATSRGEPGSQANRVSDARAWAFFLEDRIAFGAWTVTPGVRHERIRFTFRDYARGDAERTSATVQRENGVDVWMPGVGVTFAADPSLTLLGGVHKGFGPPGPGAVAETRAEESVNYELGLRWLSGTVQAQVVGFLNAYDNILGAGTLATGESGAGDLFNGGRVDVKGLELSLEYTLATGRPVRLPVRLAYTWTDARFGSSFESDYDAWGEVESGDRLPYLPEHQLFANVRVEASRWSAGVSATATGAMRTVAGRGPIPVGHGTDAYTILGITGEYELARSTRVFAGVQNLADSRYIVARRPAGARPGLPRTAMLGLRFSAF